MKRVKQVLTRFATMFLALLCVIGMGTPVLADNVIPETGVFTVGGLDIALGSGIQVDAYQIISLNLADYKQAANPLYIWDETVASWMTNEENTKTYGSYVKTLDTNDGINYVSDTFIKEYQITTDDGTTNVGVSDTVATKFYEELAAEIRKSQNSSININPTPKKRVDIGEDGVARFENMKPGVYLVTVTGGVKTYQPTVVRLVPTYVKGDWIIQEVSVDAKSTNPSITKTVADENQTVAVGEAVKYTLDITVPDYPIDSVKRYFTVEDTMPDGIEYINTSENPDEKAITVSYIDSTNTEHFIPESTDENLNVVYYEITLLDTSNPGKGFKIEFKDAFFTKYGDVRKLTVKYKGTVVKEGFTQNPDKLENTAILTYNSDPYNADATLDNKVLKPVSASARVYSYRIQINKVNKEGAPLEGALFQIFTKTEEGISEEPLKFTGDNGDYVLTPTAVISTSSTPIPLLKTSLQVSDVTGEGDDKTGGTLLIKGLDVGTYVIKEVVAPEGFVLPEGQMEVTITDANTVNSKLDGSIDSVSHKETGSFELYKHTGTDIPEDMKDGVYITNTDAGQGTGLSFNNTVTIDVLNTSSRDANFILPSTGGMGTLIFTVGGLFVMAGAVVLAVVMYKKKNA